MGRAKGEEAQYLAVKIYNKIDDMFATEEPTAQGGEGEADDGIPTEKEKAFEAAAAAPAFDMRSSVGYWWSVALKNHSALSAAYAALGRGYEAQRAFRREWVQARLQTLRQERRATRASIESDMAEGAYEPPEVILEREGGGKSGLKETMNIIKETVADTKAGRTFRGRKYIEKNPRSQG